MSFQPKPLASLALSLLLIVTLLINVGLTPVHASTPQNSLGPTDCPDSLVVMATKEARTVLEQAGVILEGDDHKSDDAQTERAKSQNEDSGQAEEPVEDDSLPISSSKEDSLIDDEGASPNATISSPAEPQEPQDFWGSVWEFWNQIREVRIDMPELTFEEAMEGWSQIRQLRVKTPDLSFEEAREGWSQIRNLRIEIPDLSPQEAMEIWNQIRELQIESPDLSFYEARENWNQIQGLRVYTPDLNFEEAKEVWSQIRQIRIEIPDLSFVEAQEVWSGQIRELQIKWPDLSFEEAGQVWSQIREIQLEMPDLSFEEARRVWSQIRELQLVMPDLSFEEAKKVWGEIVELWKESPDLSFEEIKEIWLNGLARHFEAGAKRLLMEQGFEDTDGDGELNWPPGSPFSGKNVDVELIIGGTGGLVIGLVPVLGDAVDVAALTIGTDPFTGECLTLTEQVLLAIAIISFLPISVKSVRIIGKLLDNFQPVFRKLLVNSFPELPSSVRRLLLSDLVDPKYEEFRVIVGEGGTSTAELADQMGLYSFGKYREDLMEFTGVKEEVVKDLEAHHILPQAFEQKFLDSGIDSIHDPRLLVWVDRVEHKSWSPSYSKSWDRFFEQHQNPTKSQILEEAQRLAEENGYEVLFRVSP